MNKKEYKFEIENELKKYKLDNYGDLLYQAFDGVNQVEEGNLVGSLGSPSEYIEELLEINEIEIDVDSVKKEKTKLTSLKNKKKKPKLKNKKMADIKNKISFPTILIVLACTYVAVFAFDIHIWWNPLVVVAPVILLIYSFITKGSVVEKALIIAMIALFSSLQATDNYGYYIGQYVVCFL